jgi:hypothetical protein
MWEISVSVSFIKKEICYDALSHERKKKTNTAA